MIFFLNESNNESKKKTREHGKYIRKLIIVPMYREIAIINILAYLFQVFLSANILGSHHAYNFI